MQISTAIVRLLFLSAPLFLTACGTSMKAISGCEKIDGMEPVCRFSNPEDMDLLPDKQTLIVSQIDRMNGNGAGSLVFFDTGSQTLTPAFPHAEKTPADDDTNWGAASCLDLGSFSGDRIVKIPYAGAAAKRASEQANSNHR